MNIRILAIVSAAFAAINGLAALLAPAQFVAPYGVELPEAGLVITRLFGAHLLPLAALDWISRNDLAEAPRRGARLGVVVANILTPALGIIVVVIAVAAGTISQLGWVNVVLLAVLLIAWVYYGLGRERKRRSTRIAALDLLHR